MVGATSNVQRNLLRRGPVASLAPARRWLIPAITVAALSMPAWAQHAQAQQGQRPRAQAGAAQAPAAQAPATQAPAGQRAAGDLPSVVQSDQDKASYGLGMDIAKRFAAQGIDLNLDLLIQGFRDAAEGKPSLVTTEEFQSAMITLHREGLAKVSARNLAEGKAYLAKNGARKEVKTLPSGLQYEQVRPGRGAMPKPTDMVKAHYRGTFINGEEFDSSLGGEPLEIRVDGVIPGWTEALQMMRAGEKGKLAVPPALGYGEDGFPPDIGPNSVLLFDIELIEVVSSP